MHEAEESLDISGLYTSILGKSLRMNPHLLCLLITIVERVEVLQPTGSMPAPPFIFMGFWGSLLGS